jgi:hypothetical protein
MKKKQKNRFNIVFWRILRGIDIFLRRFNMQNGQQANKNPGSIMNPKFAGTNPQKVKQEIQKDVSQGEGAMTSREAGSMRD